MAVIGFFMLPELGHLIGPIKLAKSLAKKGYQTCFFGTPDVGSKIRNEGMGLISIFEKYDGSPATIHPLARSILNLMIHETASKIELDDLLDLAVYMAYAVGKREIVRNEISDLIEKLQSAKLDLLLIDYGVMPIAFIAKRLGVKCALLNPMIWEPRLFEKTRIDYPAALDTPVIRLCPEDFDLPWSKPKNYTCYYIEPSIDLDRKQEAFDFERLQEPFIFCSFGSQERVYTAVARVIELLIEVAAARPEWRMVVSLGGELRANAFDSAPPNVRFFNHVPQLQALRKASLMITHGGLNSVKECIFFGVPMIVIPVDTDQPVNAERVVYHGLGLAENFRTISFERLSEMIDRALNEPAFKARVESMRSKFIAAETSGIGVSVIEQLIHRTN
jgi:UDP:flavonoid glycosyltransferase YjiC (YdhE family)